jgi:hypothetical protein
MIIFVFFNFFAFCPLPWQQRPFWKFRKKSAHLLIMLNIPVKFHWFPLSSRREMCRINFWRKKERKKKNNNKKKRSKHNMSPKLRLGDIIISIIKQLAWYRYNIAVFWCDAITTSSHQILNKHICFDVILLWEIHSHITNRW